MEMKQKGEGCSEERRGDLTRRGFLDRIFLTLAGTAIVLISRTDQALAKVSQVAAKYQNSARSGGHCFICKHYQGGGKCSQVSGAVSKNGWCKLYSFKPTKSEM